MMGIRLRSYPSYGTRRYPARCNNKTGAEDVGNSTSAAPVCRVSGLNTRSVAEISFLRRLLAVGVALGGACQNLLGDQAGVLADRRLDLGGHVGIGLEERL